MSTGGWEQCDVSACIRDSSVFLSRIHRMPSRKWRENKKQLSWLHHLARLGCCLVSLNFLWGIMWPKGVPCDHCDPSVLDLVWLTWFLGVSLSAKFCLSRWEFGKSVWAAASGQDEKKTQIQVNLEQMGQFGQTEQGDTSSSSQPPLLFQYMLLLLKHNFCFEVKRRLGTIWCVTLYWNREYGQFEWGTNKDEHLLLVWYVVWTILTLFLLSSCKASLLPSSPALLSLSLSLSIYLTLRESWWEFLFVQGSA